ncbi:cytochrome P450 [Herbihabitans rhizosphaerae]|uniref:Cytochrome P450 n=1 Tax=Herbihabitans rhizosphaerae TaxID=1872711 RepID=A0A4Q7KC28_9PSEU|nr:cytochrome P450 [Herbihabitans rhizosphaerae]RZS30528.1 cytochrome P450 [Herbihabitans rhizosphaerae]
MTHTLPTARDCPFDPPVELRERAERPISRLRFADGSLGWLVTDYAAARHVLSDSRFSTDPARTRSPLRIDHQAAPPGMFLFMDPPDHTRYRRLLMGFFTLRRARDMEPRITAIAEELADDLTSPADLVESFALPLASRVVCGLLGVPYTDHEFFEYQTRNMVDPARSFEERQADNGVMFEYLGKLVRHKRTEPADDLLSGLLELTDDELVGIGLLLLFAGHETTANMLGLGTFALLQHPDQWAALRADPGRLDGAIEELLRYLSIVQYEVNRAALEDVEVAGQVIAAGEPVLVSLPLANRDSAHFPDGESLDVGRSASGHLAFGFGVHQCLGQHLARIEMRVGFSTLLRRFPDLRLTVPADEVPLRAGRGIYGVDRLPVAW